MDATALVFEKRAWNTHVEVVDRQLRRGLFLQRPSIVENFLDHTSVAQRQQCAMKPTFKLDAPLFRQCAHPFSEGFGLEETYRYELSAAGSAPGTARDGSASECGLFADSADDRVLEILDNGQ